MVRSIHPCAIPCLARTDTVERVGERKNGREEKREGEGEKEREVDGDAGGPWRLPAGC